MLPLSAQGHGECTGYYMDYLSLTPMLLTERCPVSSRVDLWQQHANRSDVTYDL